MKGRILRHCNILFKNRFIDDYILFLNVMTTMFRYTSWARAGHSPNSRVANLNSNLGKLMDKNYRKFTMARLARTNSSRHPWIK